MPLPRCIRTAFDAEAGRLLADGWREIGTLVTYAGTTPPFRGGVARSGTPDSIDTSLDKMIGKIEWGGRLWRDPEVSKETALAETLRFVSKFQGDIWEDRRHNAGFVLIDESAEQNSRVVLLGVLPEFRRKGIARWLLGAARKPVLVAGTYADNDASCALYTSLGMTILKRERTFHKDVR